MATPRWWECKITSRDECQLGFKEGSLVFAKNGENNITLFDGWKWESLPKGGVTKVELLSRLKENHAAFLEKYYQFKLNQASHSTKVETPDMREAQEAHMSNLIIPIDALFGRKADEGYEGSTKYSGSV